MSGTSAQSVGASDVAPARETPLFVWWTNGIEPSGLRVYFSMQKLRRQSAPLGRFALW